MARTVNRFAVAAIILAAAHPASAACIFDQNDEITNPFAPGCGDVMLTYTANDNSGNNIALGYPPPIPVASLTPVDGFRTYASLFARHQALLTLHDEVTGQVVGQTIAGRDIWAYVIGDTDNTTSEGFAEGAVLVNGGVHAREWQTPEAVTGLFEALVERKADAGLGQYLIENMNTVLVPVNNVDGFLQTQLYPTRVTADREQPREGRMRRKNLRNPMTQGTIDSDIATIADNFWGVDLNRNSAAGFGQENASSTLETSLVYRSTAPNTEPELLALQNAATLGPTARLRFYSDTHSFGQVYLAPTTGNARRNANTQTLALRMTAASGRTYTFGPDAAGAPGAGTTADHFGFTLQIPSWTMEIEPINGGQDYGGLATHGHSGFILPDSQVARMRDDVVRQYLLGFYRQSGPPVAIAAQIRDTQSGTTVYDASWQMNSAASRALATTTNQALIPGRNYRLWIAFNKPMRMRDINGAVVPYQGQNTGPSVGTVTLEIPSLAAGQDLQLAANATWLKAPGGAPNGYRRYSDDAFAVDFTLPATINVAAATAAVLTLNVRDLAEMTLDTNPATAVDWGGGGWLRYENTLGVAGDDGGIDCALRPFIAMAAAAPPATTATCREAAPAPPPPPPPRRSGGGGDGLGLLCLIAGLLLLREIQQSARRQRSL